MFDIKKEAAQARAEEESAVVHIRNRDDTPAYYENAEGERLPVTITVAGENSERARQFDNAMRRRKINSRRMTMNAIFEDALQKAVACTITWDGFAVGDTLVEPTQHNIEMLYRECPWILDQIAEARNDSTLFTRNESSS